MLAASVRGSGATTLGTEPPFVPAYATALYQNLPPPPSNQLRYRPLPYPKPPPNHPIPNSAADPCQKRVILEAPARSSGATTMRPETPFHTQLRYHPLPKPSTAALYLTPLLTLALTEIAASPSLTPLLTPSSSVATPYTFLPPPTLPETAVSPSPTPLLTPSKGSGAL